MNIIADLHIHGKHSRATSKSLSIDNLEKYGRIKGVNLIGTGDFTHPLWQKELKDNLVEDNTGILKTKSGFSFILQTEISLIYKQGGKTRKIHNIVLAPDFATVEQINEKLLTYGRLDYDGRPIFGMSCPEFVEILKQINNKIEVIPAHIWTPWFSLFGSRSGFDKIENCFKDQTKHIFALETGLSSDPKMNWRISDLDNYTLISNSDAHSYWPWRIGRECNLFELKKLTYSALLNAIKTKQGFVKTIEFWPHEGKYHYDGHRKCDIVFKPKQSIENNNICPVCRKPLTLGVLHRVEELADRPEGYVPENKVPYIRLIPLSELIAGVLDMGISTKTVWKQYNKLIKEFGSEYNVLLSANKDELEKHIDKSIVKFIMLNRQEKIKVKPGYDGVYGKPLFGKQDFQFKQTKPKQKSLEKFF
ncbi:MAG: hypothetical protein MAG795_00672 [Candidatus Woesearchaeota archaeon]|nr:hypothetical protein [Candidatus Woesearchaeota archaeon]